MAGSSHNADEPMLVIGCRDRSLRLRQVTCEQIPDDSPLRHMLLGTGDGSFVGSTSLDVDAHILSLSLLYLRRVAQGGESETAADRCALGCSEENLGDAVAFADFICALPLRQALQRRLLQVRIRQAEQARRTGSTREGFDAAAELQAFHQSGKPYTVLKGLAPSEMTALSDMAGLMSLKTLRLGSEFPRALVVAHSDVHVDLHELGLEHAPRTARGAKHGQGGRRRGKAGSTQALAEREAYSRG